MVRRIGKKKLIGLLTVPILLLTMLLGGCAIGSSSDGSEAPKIDGLTYKSTTELKYAECFDIYNYNNGYSVIDVHDDCKYLVVPEGKKTPKNLDNDMVVIKQNLKNIYCGATSAMALFDSIDALDQVSTTELKESGWTFDSIKQKMKSGDIVYAGKYSEPDYELLLDKNCDLAVESTMIYHNPEVKEMIEKLGIPVFVDRSSYETKPLGRTEWAKVYGVLTGNTEAAEKFFKKETKVVDDLQNFKNTNKTVAFFYVTISGKVVVRSSTDYVPSMIDIAGGKYAFSDLTDEKGKTSISMTMESFYEGACDADYLIYNTNIDNTVKSLDDLKAKNDIFSKFKAVKSGNCYTSGSSFYQRTDKIGEMIVDMHKILTEKNPKSLEFLEKLE